MSSDGLLRVPPRSLSKVFLEAVEEKRSELAPLTPFMRHVARLTGFGDAALAKPKSRAHFVYWFFDTYHRLRAPYRWPVAPHLLEWLNAPATPAPADAPPGRELYLTRFMDHMHLRHKPEFDTLTWDGFLQFLTWFAYDCTTQWNLPCALLPEDLAAVLNEPWQGSRLPLTRGMATRMEFAHAGRYRTDDTAAALAMSFEAVTEVLRTGDSRLLPEFVTRYWIARIDQGVDLTRYQYLAERAFHPELDPARTAEHSRHYNDGLHFEGLRHADVPSTTGGGDGRGLEVAALRPPHTALLVYRDHHTICGLSRAGKTTVDVLRQAAQPVIDIDFAFLRNFMREEYAYNTRGFCGATKAFHLLNLNPEFVPECLLSHLTKVAESDYLIGQFYWELSDIGACHECGLSLVDEVWVASEYLKQVYTRRIDAPVIVVGQAVEALPAPGRLTRRSLGLPEDSYLFLFSFDANSVVNRKNPLGLIQAFGAAFPSGSEKTGLVIKTMNTSNPNLQPGDRAHWNAVLKLAAKDRRVKILDARFSEDEMADLFEICDCYASLHRAEGFGFGPAEALARGKPVIATGYSAVTDFCTPETALLVDFQLSPVTPGAYPYMDPGRSYEWADPNLDDASARMRELYQDPEKGLRLGRQGKELMAREYSLGALWSRYRARLAVLGAVERE